MEANVMRNEFNLRFGSGFSSNKVFDDREITSFLNKAQSEYTHNRLAPWKNRPQLGLGDHEVRNAELAGLLTSTEAIKREYHVLGDETNGALLGPDLDNMEQPQEMYGVFVPIPNEALYILSERVKTIKGDVTKPNGKVLKKTIGQYEDEIFNNYNNPGDNLTWSFDWGSFTTAKHNGSGGYDSSTKTFSKTNDGHNMTGTNSTSDGLTPPTYEPAYIDTDRSVYLLPGKGWKIEEYIVRYVKEPADMHVDVQTPSLQVHCELAPYTHSDIVDLAVKLASAAVVPEQSKYEVNQVESKEDE